MNGYEFKKVTKERDAYRAHINRTATFRPGSFTTFKVSNSIRILRGVPNKKLRRGSRKISLLVTMKKAGKRKRRKKRKKTRRTTRKR